LQSSTALKRFRPGELAPVTGVYLARHARQHRAPHEVVVIRGEQLPPCRTCKLQITFEVVKPVSHVLHDWDFSGLSHSTPKPERQDFADVRIFPRSAVQLPISVSLTHTSRPVLVEGSTCDLSEGGVGAEMEEKLAGTPGTFSVTIAFGHDHEKLCLRARLRHRSGLRHGFEFTRTTALERAAIRQFCERQRNTSLPSGL
jgi:PilZ domain-containing protein